MQRERLYSKASFDEFDRIQVKCSDTAKSRQQKTNAKTSFNPKSFAIGSLIPLIIKCVSEADKQTAASKQQSPLITSEKSKAGFAFFYVMAKV